MENRILFFWLTIDRIHYCRVELFRRIVFRVVLRSAIIRTETVVVALFDVVGSVDHKIADFLDWSVLRVCFVRQFASIWKKRDARRNQEERNNLHFSLITSLR